MQIPHKIKEKKLSMAAWKKLAILGKGSYATVYLATVALPQECNEKVVAVKSSSPFSFSIASMQKEKEGISELH